MKQKKTWQTPQIVVIARCNPEENVLAACKVNYSDCKTSNEHGTVPSVTHGAS